MTRDERRRLREAARAALVATHAATSASLGVWTLQTSNSFRRIGLHGDGDVVHATTHPTDRHPDLSARPGVLEYIVAAQPHVVLELLDHLDEVETALAKVRGIVEKIGPAPREMPR